MIFSTFVKGKISSELNRMRVHGEDTDDELRFEKYEEERKRLSKCKFMFNIDFFIISVCMFVLLFCEFIWYILKLPPPNTYSMMSSQDKMTQYMNFSPHQ